MTDAEKLTTIKTLLDDGSEMPSDEKLNAYLSLAKNEILNWLYWDIGGVPEDVTNLPSRYDGVQIYAVIAGYTHAGAEGEGQHIENGVHRTFNYDDMVGYIRDTRHVTPYVRVGAAT